MEKQRAMHNDMEWLLCCEIEESQQKVRGVGRALDLHGGEGEGEGGGGVTANITTAGNTGLLFPSAATPYL